MTHSCRVLAHPSIDPNDLYHISQQLEIITDALSRIEMVRQKIALVIIFLHTHPKADTKSPIELERQISTDAAVSPGSVHMLDGPGRFSSDGEPRNDNDFDDYREMSFLVTMGEVNYFNFY